MAMRSAFGALLSAASLSLVMLVAAGNTATDHRDATPVNPPSDKREKLAPAERAGVLARAVGNWCIGTETFLMGMETAGAGKGNAYWSLRCADGGTWAIQIDPLAEI